MNPVLINKLVRHGLQFVSGVLVFYGISGEGVLDPYIPYAEAFIGGGLSLASMWYMYRRDKKEAK